MSSILQIAASRANGAKSRGPITDDGKARAAANSIHSTGPVTPEGKARSARNSTRHGLLAQSVVLGSESDPGFTALLAELTDEFQPETSTDRRLVEVMALADWRRSRLWCLEMATYTHAINAQERTADPIADQENAEIPAMHTALAFAALCDQSNALDRLNRYEVRYSRDYHRVLLLLKSQQASKSKISKRTEPNIG